MTLLDAIVAVGISYHAAANESSAVIMAATDAYLTDIPGVAVLSMAPGVSNGVNGILHAYMDGLPVVIISGQHPAARQPFIVRQAFEVERLMWPATKWTGRISAGTDPVMAICKALDIASAQRPGPVFLELAEEVARAEVQGEPGSSVEVLLGEWSDRGPGRVRGNAPTAASFEGLRRALVGSKRPVIVIGGRRRDVSAATAKAFCERYRVPMLMSSAQKGLGTSADPYCAGTFLNGNLEWELTAESDLLLMVGPEGFDFYNRSLPPKPRKVAITSGPLDEWLFSFDERIVADPERMLRQLVDESGTRTSSEWDPNAVAEYRRFVRSSLLEGNGSALAVPNAVDSALSAAPTESRIVADAGFSKPIVALLSEPRGPGRYVVSNGLSTMGFAIPAALAAARASDIPVLAFLGDGSLLMRAAELALANDLRSPVALVAIMDGALSQIAIKQERLHLETVGVALPDISCARLAEALGTTGVDARTSDEVRQAVSSALSRRGVSLIGVHVDPRASRRVFEILRA